MIPRPLAAVVLLLSAFTPAVAQQSCSFTLVPSSINAPAASDTVGSFEVRASAGTCVRNAVSNQPDWLTISFGTTGTGNGLVGYRVEANRTASARTGIITVGNAPFTVNQAAGSCSFSAAPLSARVSSDAGSGSIQITTGCQWAVTTNASWLRATPASGTGNGQVQYNYDANPSTATRTATITIGTLVFTLTQTGIPCSLRLTPAAVDAPGDGGIGSVTITAPACPWRAISSAPWVTLTSADNGTGNGTIDYRIAANTATTARSGTITVNDQAFTIRQAATQVPIITGITNAASYGTGSVAPGEVVAIFGSQMGPGELAGAQLAADGQRLATIIAGTRVLFDGVPAPMVYSRADVLSAIVPYGTAGKGTVPVIVEYQGRRSAPVTLRIADTAPGIFTADQSGRGQGAIFNEDLTRNGGGNPARRGTQVVLFVTGEGLLTPPQEDGRIVGLDQPQAAANVSVSIGGANATVVYKGAIFGVTAGVLQINAVVPAAAPTGAAVPINVVIGGVSAQAGVTVAIVP